MYCFRGVFSIGRAAGSTRSGSGVALLALLLVGAASWPWPTSAAPYRPADDRVVLERLPIRPGDPVQRELQRLRAAHEADPADAGAALDLARRYFNLALDSGDARYVGYAEAALSAWRRPWRRALLRPLLCNDGES